MVSGLAMINVSKPMIHVTASVTITNMTPATPIPDMIHRLISLLIARTLKFASVN